MKKLVLMGWLTEYSELVRLVLSIFCSVRRFIYMLLVSDSYLTKLEVYFALSVYLYATSFIFIHNQARSI